MNHQRSATALCLTACGVLLALTAIPYAFVGPSVVNVYYRSGIAGPFSISLIALIALITLLASGTGRLDQALSAGIVLMVGFFTTLLSFSWAFTVPSSLVGGFTTVASFAYHRWLFIPVSGGLLLVSGWYSLTVLSPGFAGG